MKHGHGDQTKPMKGWPMMKQYPHAVGLQHSMSPPRKMGGGKKMPKKGSA